MPINPVKALMSSSSFASSFAATSKADWLKLVEAGLKGASFDDALVSELYEGMRVNPLYTREDFEALKAASGGVAYPAALRGCTRPGAGRTWSVIQLLDHFDFTEANRQLREDLENGVNSIVIQLGGNIPYGGAYTAARTVEEFALVFADLPLDSFDIRMSGGFDTLPGCALIAALSELRGGPSLKLRGSAGLDPLSIVVASGYVPADRDQIFTDSVDAAHYLKSKGHGWRPFTASGRAWHQAGASAACELACTLAATVTYWRKLVESGFTIYDAVRAVDVTLTADADLFLTIAKFRAARLLWARAAEVAGAAPSCANIFAEMSFRMVAERDPYVNLLRGTAAAFGALIGGAGGLLLIPFNTRAGTPDAFARRLARNTQAILREESHLGQVADAAGGSWYAEQLTSELAASAWDNFRDIEAKGGLLPALEDGMVGDAIWLTRQRGERAVRTAGDPITGISMFPDLFERPVSAYEGEVSVDLEALNREGDVPVLPEPGQGARFAAMVDAARQGATLRGLERSLERVYERRQLLSPGTIRQSEPFERLRRTSDLALHRVGARPPVFVAALGAPSEFASRLAWVKNFFEAGGFEILVGSGLNSLDALQRDFQDSPAPVACLCSSDEGYSFLPDAAQALKDAGAAAVYLAAPPSVLKLFGSSARGIDRVIYEGCDMLSMLEELHHIMRVEEMGSMAYENYDQLDEI
jgi:methylmalonyl-CoA mutase